MRNQSLDVLRGIAILLVLAFHFPYFPVVSRVGWCGVDLFFVLSGYLISGLLFRELRETGSIQIGRFLLRRGLKIWPALYVFLAVMFPLCARLPRGLTSLGSSALFYANYADPIRMFGHMWSLAVEEHFYIVLPCLLLVLVRTNHLKVIPWLYVLLFFGCLDLRFLFPTHAASGTQYRVDALFAGVTLRYLRTFHAPVFAFLAKSRNLPLAAVLLSAALIHNERVLHTVGLSCLSLGFALVLAWSVDRTPHGLGLKLLAKLGVYSYAIYLWQQAFIWLYVINPSLPRFVLVISCSITFGILMAKAVEIPMLRLRDRLIPANSFSGETSHRQPVLRSVPLDESRSAPLEAECYSSPQEQRSW